MALFISSLKSRCDIQWLREEEKKRNGKLRVRKNAANMGAPESRNCGISESAADWILFLDDDVIPCKNLLSVNYLPQIDVQGLQRGDTNRWW